MKLFERLLARLRLSGAGNTLRALLLALLSANAAALDLTGVPNSHDPAGLIRDGNTYYHFTTGDGIWYSTSQNLTHWTPAPQPVFPGGWPSWINSAVPGFNGHFWAPDVIYMNGYYYLYYSVSTFGSSRSAIGVVRTPSLNNPNWQDQGVVISSNGGSNEKNAIDPALFRDTDGRVYMSYGSWFDGIGVVEINPSTGKTTGNVSHLYGGGHQSIEAPYITKNGNYYYLFVNRGSCCNGLQSTYYIEVGRSTNVRGPYTGWRTALPNREGKYHGPGHVGLLQEGSCSYVSIHYYDVSDNGTPKLDILSMSYQGGWPSFTRNFTPGNCPSSPAVPGNGTYVVEARHSGKALSVENNSSANGANVEQRGYTGATGQRWQLTDLGNGYHRLVNANSGRSLDVWEINPDPGTNIAQWDYWGGDGQQWQLESVGGGYFRIRSRLSNNVLDVNGLSQGDGASVIQWSVTGNGNQEWFFRQP